MVAKTPKRPPVPSPARNEVKQIAAMLENARKPVVVMGSQSVVESMEAHQVADALRTLGVPVFLGGCRAGSWAAAAATSSSGTHAERP